MIFAQKYRSTRRGGIYIVVLGTSMIVAVLGLSALLAQRIQNRMLTASADVRQAQLNANTAVEIALITAKQSNSWRTQLDADSYLFKNKSTGTGSTFSVKVTDALNDPATATADRPITLLGIGEQGAIAGNAPRTTANQRVEVTVDPRRQPHDCLKSGNTSAPDWNTIVQHYQSLGTAIDINSLGPPQLARNGDFVLTNLSPYWTGDITGLADDADIQRIDNSGSQYLRVYNREGNQAGGAQTIGSLIKAGKTYTATIKVAHSTYLNQDRYRVSFYPNPNSATAPTQGALAANQNLLNGWKTVSVTFTVPNWTDAQLANAIVIVQSNSRDEDFYLDDLSITEVTTEKHIYRQVLSPSVNPFGVANANGFYYVDCGGTNTLVIERSRIIGTLLVINPAANSRIGNGPIHWSPAQPGYPVLLVNGAFSIQATSADLSETVNAFNFNPAGAPYYTATPSTDSAIDDTYPMAEAVRGLVGISGNLTYQNSSRITGRVFVGGTTTGTPTFTYRPDSLLNPPPPLGGFYTYRYDRRPASVRKAVQ